jgi:hypothetical protein
MLTLGERLQGKLVLTESGCWEFAGARDSAGYGRIGIGHRNSALAHRVAWNLWTGDDPEVVRHAICDNPPCCNPLHLAAGSHADNVTDKVRKGRQTRGEAHPNKQKTHCKRGHEFTPDNTYEYPNQYGGTRRHCKACQRYVERKRKNV